MYNIPYWVFKKQIDQKGIFFKLGDFSQQKERINELCPKEWFQTFFQSG